MEIPWSLLRTASGEKCLQYWLFSDDDAIVIPESDVASLILFLQTCGETWRRGEER